MVDSNPIITCFRLLVPSLYLLATIAYILEFIKNRKQHYVWTRPVLVLSIVSTGILLILLFFQNNRVPFDTVYRGMLFCSFMITLLYAGIELLFQNGWYGAFLLPITFCTTTFAILNLNKGAPLPDSMHSMYFVVHASILFMAYACFFLSFAISMMYLIQHHEIKQHRLGALFKRLPALSDMDSSVMRLDALGLGLLVFGIITGFLWMEMAIGMPVRLSFKIGLSILVVLAYLAEHLLRIGKGWNGPKACWLSIAGFAFVLVTLLAGRHGY